MNLTWINSYAQDGISRLMRCNQGRRLKNLESVAAVPRHSDPAQKTRAARSGLLCADRL